MKTCPKCAEQVQDEAQVCKHCGVEFTMATGDALLWFVGIIAAIMLIAVLVG